MNPVWLLRAKRWVQNPPSKSRVMLIAWVLVFCFILYGIETVWGWPDALTVNPIRR